MAGRTQANNLASRKRNKDPKRIEYMKRYHASHRKDRSAYKAAYDAANKDKLAAYRLATVSVRKVKSAAHYLANRDRILARVKGYTSKNHERVMDYHARYYAANTDKMKAENRAYRKANPDKKIHCENRRRARKAGNGGSHTLQQRKELFDLLGNVCFYCEAPPPLTIDHNVPLKRGGTDDISNILPACRSCNSKKNTRTAAEFLQKLNRNHCLPTSSH